MKPLIILLGVFLVTLVATKFMLGNFEFSMSGQIAMSAMLLFTAIGHFAFTKGMAMMLPQFIPYKTEMVLATGLIEIMAAIGLFIPSLRLISGWLLIVFFILILPANIYAATKHVDYQKGTFEGTGLTYLWFRIPLQILFIFWTLFSVIQI